MIPVDRGLRGRRRADLDTSRLTLNSRNNPSPRKSPDTWNGGTHGAGARRVVEEDFTSVASSRPEKTREIVAPTVQTGIATLCSIPTAPIDYFLLLHLPSFLSFVLSHLLRFSPDLLLAPRRFSPKPAPAAPKVLPPRGIYRGLRTPSLRRGLHYAPLNPIAAQKSPTSTSIHINR